MRYCAHCGKEIADQAVICLNCGCGTGPAPMRSVPLQSAPTVYSDNDNSDLANWAKICGIVSFFIGWFALGITAIVLACMSKDEKTGQMNKSAKVGFVCGIISTVLSCLAVVLLIVLYASWVALLV